MSFTIKCDKCGNEQVFNEGDEARNTHIDMEIHMYGAWEQSPTGIAIYCENDQCNHKIDLKY